MSESTKTYSYEEAYEASLEFFGQDGELGAKIVCDKYLLRDNEGNFIEKNPNDLHRRLARELARVEAKKFKKPFTEDEIFEFLREFRRIIPQGGPLFGIGNPYQYVTVGNCYVLPPIHDSYPGIHYTDTCITEISKRRGGVGFDISTLRPAGTPTKNSSRTSTGIIPFMERFSNTIREVGQAGRRGASLQTISVHHPQVCDFATVKRDLKKVTGANISVKLSDEFMQAVFDDTDYEQRFPVDSKSPTISRRVRARDVWNVIVENAWFMAEPGLVFWDSHTKDSPADCYAPQFSSVTGNPCSEILMSDDSCRLFVINALTYVNNPFSADAEFDWPRFKADCKIMQRLMDDVVDLEIECIDRIIKKIEDDPEPDHIKRIPREMWTRYRQNAINGRRTGSGQTALGDAIAALEIGYGIDESIQFVDDFYRTLKEGCYESSVEMAEELGPFPLYDASKELACPYILRLKEQFPALWERMQKSGRRNIALLTTAPAGTISNLAFAGEVNGKKFFGTSSGIEPVFQLSYIRRKKINHDDKEAKVDFVDQSGDKWQNFTVVHPPAQYWSELTGEKDLSKSPWFGFCAEEIDWLQRVKLQGIATKHLCHAVSSTINLPEDVTKEKVAEIYETAYKMGCKGITCYRKNCRSGVLIDVESSTKPSKIKKTKAPKRPRSLPCEVHHLSVKGTKYGVIVGLLDGDPYEVLVSSKPIPASVIKGNLVRVKRGEYNLVYASKLNGETKSLDGVSHCDAEEEALLRMTSTALRHGADIAFIVQQLEKTKGEMHGFAKSVARTLKKYVPDGTLVTGENCPDCGGSDLRRQEGCVSCQSCSWSKCS